MEDCKSCGVSMIDITTNQLAMVGCQRFLCPECGHKKTIQVDDVEDILK